MADDETEPAATPLPLLEVPDMRVVSVVHDADNDRMSVVYDDDLDPHHALGLLIAGAFRQLGDLEMGDYLLEEDDE